MSAIVAAIAEQGLARLVDWAFTAAQAGLERTPLVAKVREMEAAGKTPDEITDTLQKGRQEAEVEAQGKVDRAPEA